MLVINSLILFTWNYIYFTSFLKDIFAVYRTLICLLLSFSALKIFNCLLLSLFLLRSQLKIWCLHCWRQHVSFLWLLSKFSLHLVSHSLLCSCWSKAFLLFILLGFYWASLICSLLSFIRLGKISAMSSSHITVPRSLFPLFLELQLNVCYSFSLHTLYLLTILPIHPFFSLHFSLDIFSSIFPVTNSLCSLSNFLLSSFI